MRFFSLVSTIKFFLLISFALLLPLSQQTAQAASSSPAGLLALYDFSEGNGAVVHDVSGVGTPLDLRIGDTAKTSWLAGGGLAVNRPTLIAADQAPTKVSKTIKATNEITVEAWIQPASTTLDGPARVVTLSTSPHRRNFTLGQQKTAYDARLRSTGTNKNGTPSLSSPSGVLTTQLTHVVYSRDAAGHATLYVNGVRQSNVTVSGDLGNWDDSYRFALANELTGDRPWLGNLYRVALYSRALNADEIAHSFVAGLQRDTSNETSVSTAVDTDVNGGYELYVSSLPDRSGASLLDGSSVEGDVYVFTGPDSSVQKVEFFIDNTSAQGTSDKRESNAPYDLGGSASDDTALPFDTTKLTDGAHTLTAALSLVDGTRRVVTASFTVVNDTESSSPVGNSSPDTDVYALFLSIAPDRSGAVALDGASAKGDIYVFSGPDTSVQKVEFFIDNTSAQGAANKTENRAPYDLGGSSTDGTAFPFDTTKLTDGVHTLTAALSLADGTQELVYAAFTVANGASTSAENGTVTLSWTAPTTRSDGMPLLMSEIASYTVYYGSSGGSYSSSINVPNSTTTTLTVTDLPPASYDFVVTARDISGLESMHSSAVTRVVK